MANTVKLLISFLLTITVGDYSVSFFSKESKDKEFSLYVISNALMAVFMPQIVKKKRVFQQYSLLWVTVTQRHYRL